MIDWSLPQNAIICRVFLSNTGYGHVIMMFVMDDKLIDIIEMPMGSQYKRQVAREHLRFAGLAEGKLIPWKEIQSSPPGEMFGYSIFWNDFFPKPEVINDYLDFDYEKMKVRISNQHKFRERINNET